MKCCPFYISIASLFAIYTNAFSTTPSKPELTESSSWKDFYEASELRFVQLQSDSQEQITSLQEQVEASILQRDLAMESAKLAETTSRQLSQDLESHNRYHENCRQQFLTDIRDLQDERDRLEQRWAEECERSQKELANSQRQHAKERRQEQEKAQAEMDRTIAEYERKIDETKQKMEQLEVLLADQQRNLADCEFYIDRLEKERRSFRCLLGLSLQLLKRRVGRIIGWILPSRQGKPQRRRQRRNSVDEPVMMVDEDALLMAARRFTNGGML